MNTNKILTAAVLAAMGLNSVPVQAMEYIGGSVVSNVGSLGGNAGVSAGAIIGSQTATLSNGQAMLLTNGIVARRDCNGNVQFGGVALFYETLNCGPVLVPAPIAPSASAQNQGIAMPTLSNQPWQNYWSNPVLVSLETLPAPTWQNAFGQGVQSAAPIPTASQTPISDAWANWGGVANTNSPNNVANDTLSWRNAFSQPIQLAPSAPAAATNTSAWAYNGSVITMDPMPTFSTTVTAPYYSNNGIIDMPSLSSVSPAPRPFWQTAFNTLFGPSNDIPLGLPVMGMASLVRITGNVSTEFVVSTYGRGIAKAIFERLKGNNTQWITDQLKKSIQDEIRNSLAKELAKREDDLGILFREYLNDPLSDTVAANKQAIQSALDDAAKETYRVFGDIYADWLDTLP